MSMVLYNFLGYRLSEIKYVNKTNKDNSYISIVVCDDNFNDINNQYSISIRVSTDFEEEESYFIFHAGFLINDIEWYSKIDKNMLKSIFLSIVFPFIREKIYTITSDMNTGLLIPTIDLRNVDCTNEIRLVKTSK